MYSFYLNPNETIPVLDTHELADNAQCSIFAKSVTIIFKEKKIFK